MKTKFFRVAMAGKTVDGREIKANWLQEMADSYDPKKYGARIFVEHIRGLTPNFFPAMGDIISLKTQTDEIGGEKTLCLYAEIAPTDEMVQWVKNRQKIYTSVEIDPNFTGSNKAYLVGLGITDSPASLGTEALSFCNSRKNKDENLFTPGIEADIQLSDKATLSADTFLNKLMSVFNMNNQSNQPPVTQSPAPTQETTPAPAPTVENNQQTILNQLEALNTKFSAMEAQVKDIANFKAEVNRVLENTSENAAPNFATLPKFTGVTVDDQTDC